MTVIHLIARDVAIAALAAHANEQLVAQTPGSRLRYRHNGHPCAIGAALTDEQAADLDRKTYCSVGSLIRDGFVTADDGAAISGLQSLHDAWAGAPSETKFQREAQFLAFARSLTQ